MWQVIPTEKWSYKTHDEPHRGEIISMQPMWRYPKSERNRIRNFFPIPNFSDTESDTFFDTKFFRYRIQYFFWYQIVLIPNPKPSKKWKNFETEKIQNRNVTQSNQNQNETESKTFFSDTKLFRYRIGNHQKYRKVSKPRSFKTETSHSAGNRGTTSPLFYTILI